MIRTNQGHVVRALTIAGSDSGGGAGIQADLKTMHQFQVYGMSVLTSLTAQNTIGVQGIYEVNPDFVRLQLESVYTDFGVDAVKTGMLANADIIHTVADFLRHICVEKLVVDPVMVAKGGAPLLRPESVAVLKEELLPLTMVITPNVMETEALCGYPIRNFEDCHRAAIDIAALGPRAVVIKGGHMPREWMKNTSNLVVDLLYAEGQFTYFAGERMDTHKTHGTGCTFSSALTAMLARGASVLDAMSAAKAFVHEAVRGAEAWDVGKGHGPTDHSAPISVGFKPVPSAFYIWQDNQTWLPYHGADLPSL
jgi:hydroxymethylpyrimidine/phosphomethylpyrimidine kinase